MSDGTQKCAWGRREDKDMEGARLLPRSQPADKRRHRPAKVAKHRPRVRPLLGRRAEPRAHRLTHREHSARARDRRGAAQRRLPRRLLGLSLELRLPDGVEPVLLRLLRRLWS